MKMKQERDLLLALYDRIPKAPCKRGCTMCCGPIPFSRWERKVIGRPECFEDFFVKTDESFNCIFAVKDVGCLIYKNRPLICRLYGCTPWLQCPFNDRLRLIGEVEEQQIMMTYYELFPINMLDHFGWDKLRSHDKGRGFATPNMDMVRQMEKEILHARSIR
jgi:hypothetical protein